MKKALAVFITVATVCTACNSTSELAINDKSRSIIGTWTLVSGLIIKNKDSVLIDYTRNQEMIKIISDTHFAFFRHDLTQGKDSSAIFVSGGGRCLINDSTYTEYLDYCNYRGWENNKFEFSYLIKGDTLITQGIEKIEALKVDQFNIETYIKVK